MKSTKQQRTSTSAVTFSVSIVLLLLGFCLLVYLHANRITKSIKQHMDIVVEMEQNLESKQIHTFMEQLKLEDGVKKESVNWVNAKAGFESLKEEYLEGVNIVENPLSDIVTFNVEASYYNEGDIENLKLKVLKNEIVSAFTIKMKRQKLLTPF